LDVYVGVGGIVDGIHLLGFHEIAVQVLNFDGGAAAVEGSLGECKENAGDETEEGGDYEGAALALEETPVFDDAEAVGIGFFLGVGKGWHDLRMIPV
jgi:hypothetical protein